VQSEGESSSLEARARGAATPEVVGPGAAEEVREAAVSGNEAAGFEDADDDWESFQESTQMSES